MISAACHCGNVRFEVAEAPVQLTYCNCSICRRLGGLWAYYRRDQVRFLSPPGTTRSYEWGDRMLALHSCPTCGCTTHWVGTRDDAPDRMGVNARMMDPQVTEGLPVKLFDGADTWTTLGWTVQPFPSTTDAPETAD